MISGKKIIIGLIIKSYIYIIYILNFIGIIGIIGKQLRRY